MKHFRSLLGNLESYVSKIKCRLNLIKTEFSPDKIELIYISVTFYDRVNPLWRNRAFRVTLIFTQNIQHLILEKNRHTKKHNYEKQYTYTQRNR